MTIGMEYSTEGECGDISCFTLFFANKFKKVTV